LINIILMIKDNKFKAGMIIDDDDGSAAVIGGQHFNDLGRVSLVTLQQRF
jgi:hypothetical protein